jgi:hypothetical protein
MIELLMALILTAIIGIGNEIYQDAADRSLQRDTTRAKLRAWQHLDASDSGYESDKLHRDDPAHTLDDWIRNHAGDYK